MIDEILIELVNNDLLCNKSVELKSVRAKNNESTVSINWIFLI